jgi:NAD(P)-dependent dehydrogenase (short-subunit alcohol dehydrogenase family)
MTNSDKIVLVTGATGRQGGGVIRHMLPKGWKLRGLTRNPQSRVAQELRRQGVEIVQVRLVLGREFYQMFDWFNKAGFQADIQDLRRRFPEVHLQTLEEWLRNEGWHKRARRVRPPRV